ncbi:MAG TPA: hypothetical protein VNO70_21935 [Blastocatellia bacterium]|nr:hypothetical protein [Blastocatellia bacterium]
MKNLLDAKAVSNPGNLVRQTLAKALGTTKGKSLRFVVSFLVIVLMVATTIPSGSTAAQSFSDPDFPPANIVATYSARYDSVYIPGVTVQVVELDDESYEVTTTIRNAGSGGSLYYDVEVFPSTRNYKLTSLAGTPSFRGANNPSYQDPGVSSDQVRYSGSGKILMETYYGGGLQAQTYNFLLWWELFSGDFVWTGWHDAGWAGNPSDTGHYWTIPTYIIDEPYQAPFPSRHLINEVFAKFKNYDIGNNSEKTLVKHNSFIETLGGGCPGYTAIARVKRERREQFRTRAFVSPKPCQ